MASCYRVHRRVLVRACLRSSVSKQWIHVKQLNDSYRTSRPTYQRLNSSHNLLLRWIIKSSLAMVTIHPVNKQIKSVFSFKFHKKNTICLLALQILMTFNFVCFFVFHNHIGYFLNQGSCWGTGKIYSYSCVAYNQFQIEDWQIQTRKSCSHERIKLNWKLQSSRIQESVNLVRSWMLLCTFFTLFHLMVTII